MSETLTPARLDAFLAPGCLVTTPDGQVRAANLSLDDRVLLEERDLIDPAGRIRVERLGLGPLAWGAESVRSLPLAAAAADAADAADAAGSLLGWLIVVALETPGHAPEQIDELAATVAALMTTRRAALETSNTELRKVWATLCAGGGEAALLGWEYDQPLVVLAAGLDPVGGPVRPTDPGTHERFVHAWRTELDQCGAPARLVDLGETLMMLLPVSLVPSVDELVAAVSVGRRFSVGVSRVIAGVAQVADAAREAERALAVGHDQGGGATTYFQRLGLDRLLALVPESEAAAYAADMLGPLAADTSEAADLRRTLRLLLDTDWNIAEAARLQYLHFMTVRFRVTKFERWLGPLADDPARRLDVAVALRILGRVRVPDIQTLIADLGLEPHPEGGYYRQTWRSPHAVTLADGRVRAASTLIYFALPAGASSAWHKVSSAEFWLAHAGVVQLQYGGTGDVPDPGEIVRVGVGVTAGEVMQAQVPAGVWQRTLVSEVDGIVSCMVSPGFDFDDFQLA